MLKRNDMESELNKAAEEYAQDETMSGLAERAFKAGAEWQREQYGCIPAEEAYMRGFAQGAKEERERMLEDAIECDVYGHCSGWLTFGYVPECDFDFKPGDKVKLIIIKKEE